MSDGTLLVPIYVDALLLPAAQPVLGPLADFSTLPYLGSDEDGLADVNSGTPWLGSTTAREPLEGPTGVLEAGVHLHWSLPDALAHAAARGDDPDDLAFLPVPDRWLVTRWRGDRLERRFLVESDYLWPPDQDWARTRAAPEAIVRTLLPRSRRTPGTPPWRHLGRCLDLDRGERPVPGDSYLGALTAVGHGDAGFAAFHPACRSVFGFHDPEITAPDPDLHYLVLGSHARSEADPLHDAPGDARWEAWLARHLGWRGAPARRMLCHGRVTGAALVEPPPAAPEVRVAVAENHVESLCALVADRMAGGPWPVEGVEAFLEALMVAEDLSRDRIDLGPRTADALHTRGFVASLADPIWSVRAAPAASGTPGAQALAEAPDLSLPDEVALLLNRLNDAQRAVNRARTALQAARRQLHLDWGRARIAATPPGDLVQDFSDAVADHDPDVVAAWLDTQVAEVQALDASLQGALTHARDAARTAVQDAVDAHNAGTAATGRWNLVQVEGPRYHQPAPPSVAVSGLPPTDRHHADVDADGTLPCGTWDRPLPDLLDLGESVLRDLALVLPDRVTAPEGPGLRRTWRPHPLFLEWLVELHPFAEGSGVDPTLGTFDPDFVRRTFNLAEGDLDLRRQPGRAPDPAHVSAYRGRGWLASGVSGALRARLEAWLVRRLRPALAARPPAHLPDSDDDAALLAWAEARPDEARALFADDDPARIALAAWKRVEDQPLLVQSLTGFSEALRMMRPDAALDIDDPLGFAEDRALAGRVAAAVGEERRETPRITADFHPIRAGDLQLVALRLVDTWGRPQDLPVAAPAIPARLRGDAPDRLALPVRLSQPCRLSLRWLDAAHDEEEMNAHPASTPVCGWLIPVPLDGGVHVHDADGRPQGMVDAKGTWRTAPGPLGGAIRPEDLPNPHLVRVVRWMTARKPDEMGALVDTLESALENIAPPPTRQQEVRALLVGRPIAVVRARMNLELSAPLARDQSMSAFARALTAWRARLEATGTAPEAPDDTRGFGKVRFPVRIGEHLRLGDGVVGYFVERDGAFEGERLWAPQSRVDWARDDAIEVFDEGEEFNLWHTLEDPPLDLTLLVDPHGAVHATCGILPPKSIGIPRDQVDRALHRIGVSLQVGPVLAPRDAFELPLPEVAGRSWAWLAREGGTWTRLEKDPVLARAAVDAAFPAVPGIWTALHGAGWLTPWPGHPDQARIVPVTRRPELPGELAALQDAITRVLDTAGRAISPPTHDARFPPELCLREGWLQLELDGDEDA